MMSSLHKSNFVHVNNTKGFSILEVVVVSAIFMIIALALVTMITDSNKQVRAITEKLLATEVQSQLKKMLENSDYCNCVFRGKRFNTTGSNLRINSSDQLTTLRTGYSTGPLSATPCNPITANFIPPVGTNIINSHLTIASIGLTNMTLVSGATYKADIQIGLSNSVRYLRPISTSVQFSIDPTVGSPTSRPFVNCSGNSDSIVTITSDSGYNGMTGSAACSAIGKTCQYVNSLNTIWEDVACPGATHCIRVCMTWYNQGLSGIPDNFGGTWADPTPSGRTNIHPCTALVGRYTTYLQAGVVRCGGQFSAVCK